MNTKEKIQFESMKLFANEEYETASLSKIADKVGISKSTIYSHYQRKEKIYLDVFKNIINKQKSMIMDDYSNDKDVEANLYDNFIKFSFIWSDNNIENKLYNKALLFPPSVLEEKIWEMIHNNEKEVFNIIKEVFKKAQEQNLIKQNLNLENITLTYNNLINGNSIQYPYLSKNQFKSMIETSWTIFWNGIKN
ncbi:TetR/AcrR family transcriptional regulator [Staphylococcus gallinarum]|uniref:TetR/AcrR family transcriptional regulator n=1 Tax=Staphylococcus gallinarum TaxID=1293 RepID=UPI001E395BC1|nr:TetR/AcrR family transcriptional regulator [Staphylococcus gallinarum]MCD8898708.1 TetR/AcrR family transcriptional regulator [Staphylococcus gallinarum]MCD8901896.1 TetR/AcrR family transcriptional regulator [Staphylococcus gallinarum]MEB6236894.1 TetR/AcrR family transcriptional regulator [Staphylococcus gallinarum]